jgi:hypothetical protein
MKPHRQPPWMKIYLSHALGTAALGAILPAGEHLSSLHALISPFALKIPGAVALTRQTADPVFAQVFLALSLLIAACLVIGAIWHVSRGGYHTKSFSSQWDRLFTFTWVGLFAALVIAVFWLNSYGLDGAQTRSWVMTKVAVSSQIGVLTVMNQLIVGFPLVFVLTLTTLPFCTDVEQRNS